MERKCYRIAADIGGTFTDFVMVEGESGKISTGKVLSTPRNPAMAIIEGVRQLIPNPEDIEFMVHGTTVGLNAFLERKGARVLLITTAGFRDTYSIARGDRKDLYVLKYHKPQRLVPRRDVHEVRERIKWDGSILEPLHPEDFEPIIEKIQSEKIQAVAVCFLHAYAYPQHELEARVILEKALPGVSITLSHEIAREWREYERASTAVMNAYIAPKVEQYLSSLVHEMRDMGVKSTLYVMQSSGGIITAETAGKQPIKTLLSGPVGGSISGASLSKMIDRPNLMCVDMGGTSFDMSLIIDGKPSVSSETHLEGLPLMVSIVDIHTIGAGGGSLAWIEAGGLRVGPQSAGADPGPACYGLGGTQPTVTDANLFLKRLGPKSLVGGRMTLDEDATCRAIHSVADQLGIDDVSLAEGMLSIINAKMADAMRTITVARGIDPRDYSLIPFGGAGPMHAVFLAEELDMKEVIVPFSPGTYSAAGMLQTDVRHDLSCNFYRPIAETSQDELLKIYTDLSAEGLELLKAEGTDPIDVYYEYSCDMRYVGQEYSVSVQVEPDCDARQIENTFHQAHQIRYGHSTPGAPIEFVTLRVAAFGGIEKNPINVVQGQEHPDPLIDYRQVIFHGRPYKTAIYNREWMDCDRVYPGPHVIEEFSATTVVPPEYESRVDAYGNIIIVRSKA